MYRTFVDNTIKEFQYNYEEERNRFIVAYFNITMCKSFGGYEDYDPPNFFLAGYNNNKNKYIIRKIPCYFHKNIIGELVPMYKYGTEIDNYYEKYDGCIDEFVKLLKNHVSYDVHDILNDGVLNDDSYYSFHYDNPHWYYGKINEPYLLFEKEKIGSVKKELIYKKILLSCMNL
jgi:hypothetical protein